jgi:glycosyltransferase involved in cell wall biosynthesis
MTEPPLVSVGMPVYDRPASMKKAINSIINQTYKNLEIIISNNASPNPEIYKILDAYAAKDSRIRLFHQPVNITAFGNYPFVLKEATGKYFTYAQDDDQWSPDYIEKLVAALEENPAAAVAVGNPFYINDDGKIIKHIDMHHISLFNILGNSKAGFIFMGLWDITDFRDYEFISYSKVLGGDHIVAAEALLSKELVVVDTVNYYKGLQPDAPQRYFGNDKWYRFRIYYYFAERLLTSKHIQQKKRILVPVILVTNFLLIFVLYGMQFYQQVRDWL